MFLDQAETNLGREDTADVQINDAYVSNVHAQIRLIAGKAYIIDIDSQNGTFVDYARIKPYEPLELMDGDVIELGNTLYIFATKYRQCISWAYSSLVS